MFFYARDIYLLFFFNKRWWAILFYIFLCKIHSFLQYFRIQRWFWNSFRLLMSKCLTGLMKPWELTFHRIWFHPDQRSGWNYTVKLTQVCKTAWTRVTETCTTLLSSCFSIFLPSNGLELNKEAGGPWVRFQMAQIFPWLEL